MKRILGPALILFACVPAARAEEPEVPAPHVYLAPTVGFIRWDGKALGAFEPDTRLTFAWGIRAGYSPFEAIAGEVVALVTENEAAAPEGSDTVLPDDPAARLTLVEFSFVVNFRTLIAWRLYPFVDLGAGAAIRSSDLEDEAGAVFDDTRLAFHLGGGLKADLSPRLSARLNVRDAFTTESRAIGERETQNTIDAVEIGASLEYRFPLGRRSGPERLR